MKKIILSAIMLMGLAFTAQAQQISKNALGLRFGGSNGFGTEVSYQRGLSDNNRLELDLGWRNRKDYNGYDDDAVKLTGIYQWVWNIDGGFNWYAGVGGGVGTYDRKYSDNRVYDDGLFAFAAGNIGIEYDFDIPLLISLDFRPEFGGNGGYYNNNYGSDVAVSLRYQF